MSEFVRWFRDISIEDIPLCGGKNASLGEMVRELSAQGVRVPDGFAVTAKGYHHVLDSAGIREKVRKLLVGLDKKDVDDLARRGAACRALIHDAGIPEAMWAEIKEAYATLVGKDGDSGVAVRSSATAEDLPGASFAGQQESFLNVRGDAALREACSRCFASLYTDRAISYRIDQGFDHEKVALSIGIQKMVRSDRGAAGVIFTIDTETGFRDVVFVTSAYGLGENVVNGSVDPDEIYVFKPTLRQGKRAIVKKTLGSKQMRLEYAEESGARTKNRETSQDDRRRFSITDEDALTLARYALVIEDHYTRKAGVDRPMDIEWAKDGMSGELFIVQARPETVQSQHKKGAAIETHVLDEEGAVLAEGHAVGQKIGSGTGRVLVDLAHHSKFESGDVLVAETTTPDWEPVMKRASAIVTSRGGRTCHAAIIARELGIPAVIGAEGATSLVKDGEPVTVSCAEGDVGHVYRGLLRHHVEKVDVGVLGRPKTHVQMNVGDPDKAFGLAMLPNDGVGLARLEFIINNTLRVHPMALVHPERVESEADRKAIDDLTFGYPDKPSYFVDGLALGVGTIAAAFYPKPVVVRLSDFKTNEYASLLGGAAFEAKEENPMIGFRGASRYAHPAYAEAFALECRAMKRVRDEMGLTNVVLMIPFCRRVDEGERVLAEMAKHGLVRGENGLEVYVMCEIPNNVMCIDAFCAIFDGISIGSNDLTQLTLGVDRDSAIVAFDFDERDPGVKLMMKLAIEGAHRNGRHAGICGQAPSDYPAMAEYLVRLGIDAMSLSPDTVLRTTVLVQSVEKQLGERPPRAS